MVGAGGTGAGAGAQVNGGGAACQHHLKPNTMIAQSALHSRTSLLGRPLKVETHYRDIRYRKKQNIIYNFLERPRGWRAAIYHFVL